MKKIILAISLSAIMLICGCASGARGPASVTPEASRNAYPNSELAESLISRVQNNIDTNSFEGFTYESTYGDVLAKIKSGNLTFARIVRHTELLAYPVQMHCIFSDSGGAKLRICRFEFTIYSRGVGGGQEAKTDLLAKLDLGLGAHREDPSGNSYDWDKEGLHAQLTWQDYNPDTIAELRIYPSASAAGTYPQGPDFLPYQLGTDVYTVNGSLKPGVLPGDEEYSVLDSEEYAILDYKDQGFSIRMWFKPGETGSLNYCQGNYSIELNGMEFSESIDYFESLADGLEGAIGAPNGRGYNIPNVTEYKNGMPASWAIGTGQTLSTQDVLDSDNKYYALNITWPGIYFHANYINTVDMSMDFWGTSGIYVTASAKEQ